VAEDPVDAVVWMMRGAWVTMALRAACVLGVFDTLGEPGTPGEVAARASADPSTVGRLLRTLTSLGLLERGDGTYVNSAVGSTLRQDHPSHARDLVLMQSSLPNLAAWHALDEAIRSGAGVYERVNGFSLWEYMSDHPEVERAFNAAMARRAADQVRALLAAVDLTSDSLVVDIGGGRGAMLSGLLREQPQLEGIVADRPAVAAEADSFFAADGLTERARGEACDFFESVPSGGDVYTIANVLHDWTDDDCVAILRTVRSAMPAGARLLVVEKVVDTPGRPFESARDLDLLDLHMLVLFGARERTQAEYDVLLTSAGFSPSRLAGTGDWNVLEAQLAG
jgi:hypothetical protein